MGFLGRFFGRDDAAVTDARRIYTKLMGQSRLPGFYGKGRFADSYDGRIDVLTLHIAAILTNLNRFKVNGERLGQALFDEMKDDFEIALREEALSDASVKKRIQPMISLFYDRVKSYAEALHASDQKAALDMIFSNSPSFDIQNSDSESSESEFRMNMSDYVIRFNESLSSLSLGQIALTEFAFPSL